MCAYRAGYPFINMAGLIIIPAWICDYIYYKVWDEVAYHFPNFDGGAVEVW